MSQTAVLCRISTQRFEELEKLTSKKQFDIRSKAKTWIEFLESFQALEYILSKNRDKATVVFIKEIFNPIKTLGVEQVESLSPEEQFEIYEKGGSTPYLDAAIILKIADFLDKVSESDIHMSYDALELNENGIYPQIWHNDNSPGVSCNERQILEDFRELKSLFEQARKEGDYILVLFD